MPAQHHSSDLAAAHASNSAVLLQMLRPGTKQLGLQPVDEIRKAAGPDPATAQRSTWPTGPISISVQTSAGPAAQHTAPSRTRQQPRPAPPKMPADVRLSPALPSAGFGSPVFPQKVTTSSTEAQVRGPMLPAVSCHCNELSVCATPRWLQRARMGNVSAYRLRRRLCAAQAKPAARQATGKAASIVFLPQRSGPQPAGRLVQGADGQLQLVLQNPAEQRPAILQPHPKPAQQAAGSSRPRQAVPGSLQPSSRLQHSVADAGKAAAAGQPQSHAKRQRSAQDADTALVQPKRACRTPRKAASSANTQMQLRSKLETGMPDALCSDVPHNSLTRDCLWHRLGGFAGGAEQHCCRSAGPQGFWHGQQQVSCRVLLLLPAVQHADNCGASAYCLKLPVMHEQPADCSACLMHLTGTGGQLQLQHLSEPSWSVQQQLNRTAAVRCAASAAICSAVQARQRRSRCCTGHPAQPSTWPAAAPGLRQCSCMLSHRGQRQPSAAMMRSARRAARCRMPCRLYRACAAALCWMRMRRQHWR